MTKERFTPKTLAEFWASAPNEDCRPQFRPQLCTTSDGWRENAFGPDLSDHVEDWRWSPQDKVIDLGCLVASDVLCFFGDKDSKPKHISKLLALGAGGGCIRYCDDSDDEFITCTPALGIWQACDGTLPELPEGLDVTVRYVDDLKCKEANLKDMIHGTSIFVIVGYCVNGKLDGYKWPWE